MRRLRKTAIVKLLSIVIFTFLLLVTPAFGDEFTFEQLEDGIYNRCVDISTYWFFEAYVDTSDFVYCSLFQLIAFNKVMRYYEEHDMFIDQIMTDHWDGAYATSDWPIVLDKLNWYLSRSIPYIPAE